ncbi:Gag-Pol polyprotein [Bienertia sinuspersici]
MKGVWEELEVLNTLHACRGRLCTDTTRRDTKEYVEDSERRTKTPLPMYGKNSGLSCESCGKSGHLKKDCWTPKCDLCGKLGDVKDYYHILGFPESTDKQGG